MVWLVRRFVNWLVRYSLLVFVVFIAGVGSLIDPFF